MFYIIKDAKGTEIDRQNDKAEAVKVAQKTPGAVIVDSKGGKVDVPTLPVTTAKGDKK